MGYLNIIIKLKRILDSVDGIGKIFTYRKYINHEHDLKENFKDSRGRLHVWFIETDVNEEPTDLNTHVFDKNVYKITGYLAVKDEQETERTLNGLVEDVVDKLRSNRSLAGYGKLFEPIHIVPEKVMFSGVLCNMVEISFAVLSCTQIGTETMKYTDTHTILSSAARTSSSNSDAQNVEKYSEGNFLVDVTAASGTMKKLILQPYTSPDGDDFFPQLDYTLEIMKTGKYRLPVTTFGKYLRLNYQISGTSASFTFSAVFEGKNPYGI